MLVQFIGWREIAKGMTSEARGEGMLKLQIDLINNEA